LPRWYWTIIYLPTPDRWTTVHVHEVGAWVKANSPPGGRVLTIDPIFPLEGGMKVYPEFAVGRFVHHVGEFMTAEERRRFHMAWAEELDRVLAERPPDAIFIEQRIHHLVPSFEAYAESHGFRARQLFVGEDKYILWTRTHDLQAARQAAR